MADGPFAGDQKEGVSLLHPYEVRFKAWLLPMVPRGIETYHLTLLTVVWSILVVVFSWLATYNRQWMWGVSLMVVAQYVSDLLDGAIGRERDTGLVKWGFYMDHFLDYLFLCAILIGYSLLMPNSMKYWMFFVFAVIGAFLVNSFLQFAATNRFRIAYWGIGPTEGRLGFIAINAAIVFLDRAAVICAVPYVLAGAAFALFFTAYNTQRQLWRLDMEAKAARSGDAVEPIPDAQGLVIRYFLVSFVLASAAFGILVLGLGGAFRGMLAGTVYVTSWLPLVLAFLRYRRGGAPRRGAGGRVKPVIWAAVVMAVCAWIAVSLMPAVADPAAYLSPTYRQQLAADGRHVLGLAERLLSLTAEPRVALEGVTPAPTDPTQRCEAFLAMQETLSAIHERTQGYHLIDFQEDPGLHTDTFLVNFAAHALQSRSVLAMLRAAEDPNLDAVLKRARDGNAGFDALVRASLTPKTLLRLGTDSSYVRLLEDPIERPEDPARGELRRALRDLALSSTEVFVQSLREHPEVIKAIGRQWTGLF